jgi:hypothetical protein
MPGLRLLKLPKHSFGHYWTVNVGIRLKRAVRSEQQKTARDKRLMNVGLPATRREQPRGAAGA